MNTNETTANATVQPVAVPALPLTCDDGTIYDSTNSLVAICGDDEKGKEHARYLIAKLNSYAALVAKNQELREALAGLLALPILKTVDGMQGAHFSSLVRAVSDAKAALE